MAGRAGRRGPVVARSLLAALPLAAFGLVNAIGALLAGQATPALLALDGGLLSLAALFVAGGLARGRWLRAALLVPALVLTLLLFRLLGPFILLTLVMGLSALLYAPRPGR